MATIQTGVASSGELFVDTSGAARAALFDAAGNRLSKTDTSSSTTGQEAIIGAGVNDGNVRHLRTDRLGSLATANNTVLFTESFEGTTLAINRWSSTNATMTSVQTVASGQQLNSALITTASTGIILRTLRSFPKLQRAPLHFKTRARISSVSNSVCEFGFGDTSTISTANTNGAYFQYTSGGAVQGVLTFNGVDLTTSPITGLNSANFYVWDIILDDDSVSFFVQDTVTGSTVAEKIIFLPSTQAKLWAATRLFVFARVFNTASVPSSAPTAIFSTVDVVMMDALTALPWKEAMASNGQSAHINPTTWAQATNWTNSTAPANATLSNTAAGYATLGGLFSFAAVAGATTDYALFGFTVPSPYSFVCTGVDIETFNTGAAVATTPTLLIWGLGVDQSVISLNNASSIKIPVGIQDLPVGAAVGAKCSRISTEFSSPVVTNAGRFLTVILRMPIATATASQVIQGIVNLKGYYQ